MATELELIRSDQRYYASTYGRFVTPDLYAGSGVPSDPQSWNRYAYVQGDHINHYDPTGEIMLAPPAESVPPPQNPSTSLNVWFWFPSPLTRWVFFFQDPPDPPPSLTGANKKQNKAFQNALKKAKNLLNKKGCADLFGGKEQAVDALLGAEYDLDAIAFIPGVNPEGNPAATDVDSQTVTINILGHFFSQMQTVTDPHTNQPVTIDWGYRTGLQGVDFQAMILLHELGHLTRVFGPDKDQATNDSYTNKVLENCFGKELKAP